VRRAEADAEAGSGHVRTDAVAAEVLPPRRADVAYFIVANLPASASVTQAPPAFSHSA
jgi:hypothetical protein